MKKLTVCLVVLFICNFVVPSKAYFQTPIECMLRRDEGTCNGNHLRFYYDSRTDRCIPFRYTGCGGNRNKFKTFKRCMRRCSNAQDAEYDRLDELTPFHCKLPRQVGMCNGRVKRFYYNHYSHECKPFTFSGCGGNSNNFMSKSECRRQCHPLSYVRVKQPSSNWQGIRWYHHMPNQMLPGSLPFAKRVKQPVLLQRKPLLVGANPLLQPKILLAPTLKQKLLNGNFNVPPPPLLTPPIPTNPALFINPAIIDNLIHRA